MLYMVLYMYVNVPFETTHAHLNGSPASFININIMIISPVRVSHMQLELALSASLRRVFVMITTLDAWPVWPENFSIEMKIWPVRAGRNCKVILAKKLYHRPPRHAPCIPTLCRAIILFE